MTMKMTRLADVPVIAPPGTTLLPFIKTKEFRYDHSLAYSTGRKQAVREMWRLIHVLRAGVVPDPGYCLHNMAGEWKGWKNCHLEGDFVLLFTMEPIESAKTLILGRCGTHSYLGI